MPGILTDMRMNPVMVRSDNEKRHRDGAITVSVIPLQLKQRRTEALWSFRLVGYDPLTSLLRVNAFERGVKAREQSRGSSR